MTVLTKALASALLIVLVVVAVPAAAPRPAPLADLLERASDYVCGFVAGFSTVVAEERYVQDSHPAPDAPGFGLTHGFSQASPRHVELRSDFLFVRSDPRADWLTFRDVFSVDGREVRDRRARLATLFEGSAIDALEQAGRIAQESYRYNLGPRQRTIADPLLALTFLEPAFRTRFAFAIGAIDVGRGTDVWIVKFEERARPSIIRDVDNHDAPASGRFWIDGATGRVVQTELKLRGGDRVMTTFAYDERIQLDVPAEMRDIAWVGQTSVTGVATYSNFRRFEVLTAESLH
jgi:hypothetical protein